MNSKDRVDEQWRDCAHIEKAMMTMSALEDAINDGCMYPTITDMHLTNSMDTVDKDKLIDCFLANIPLFIVLRPYIIQGDLFDEIDTIEVVDTLISYKNDLYTPTNTPLAPAFAGKKFSELDTEIQGLLKRRLLTVITMRVNMPTELEKHVEQFPYLYKKVY